MARLFLIPLFLVLLWTVFLAYHHKPISAGKKGYFWILGGGAGLLGFFSLMMLLTH